MSSFAALSIFRDPIKHLIKVCVYVLSLEIVACDFKRLPAHLLWTDFQELKELIEELLLVS